MKGILLAGGSGTRLYPLTKATSKQLLPVYDKPLIYYPLSILLEADIRDIIVISTPVDLPRARELLGDGTALGIKLTYLEQAAPEGIAQAFHLAAGEIEGEATALVLGDNLFHGGSLPRLLLDARRKAEEGVATFFAYYVSDPERFGTIVLDEGGKLSSIVEKSPHPATNYAVTGLYFFPSDVYEKARSIAKSDRGEYEITDLNNLYVKEKRARVSVLGRGYTWLDCGTPESLFDASNFVYQIESHEGLLVSCPEEIAFRKGYIDSKRLLEDAERYGKTAYAAHLRKVASGSFLSEGEIGQ